MSKWIVDASHSEIGFKVKHLVVSTASGKFLSFEGTVDTSKDDFSDAKISFSADINSIHTGQEQRDGHLKSADFFDAEKFPKMSFESTSFAPASDDKYILKGNLTLHGVTKPVQLEVEFGGTEKSPFGHTVAGFDVTGKIKRSDFGLTWSKLTEAGGMVVGEEVKIYASLELIKQA